MRRMQRRRIRRSRRSGITLIEVLVSVFVLTIGILGVIAALPIGVWSMNQAKIADRSAACAQGALDDARVRGLTDVDRLVPAIPDTTPHVNAYVIDPRMYNAGTDIFPFTASTGIGRYTVTGAPGVPAAMTPSVAERLFVWQDQLMHASTTDEDSRPQMEYIQVGGTDVAPDTEGEFSWMLTVSPRVTPRREYDGSAWQTVFDVTHRDITAVVFQDRLINLTVASASNEAPATEREVVCELTGGGVAGGEVTLYGDGFDLDLDETNYIMLYGDRSSTSVQGTVCHWYEIVGYGDIEPATGPNGETHRICVTLSGPDWQYNLAGQYPNDCQAVICDGVCAAFTTTISVEETWPWSN